MTRRARFRSLSLRGADGLVQVLSFQHLRQGVGQALESLHTRWTTAAAESKLRTPVWRPRARGQ